MITEFPVFDDAKVVVIGDLMLDSYWGGRAERLSPEAPVPVVNVSKVQKRLGGAANVALNIQSLGATVHLLGLIGKDEEGQSFLNAMKAEKLSSDVFQVSERPTITKLRVISQNQQLLRLDFEKDFAAVDKSELHAAYKKAIADCDLVVLSDYAKGTLSDVPELINIASACQKPVLVDPKGCDFSKYANATLLTPNLKEFKAIVGEVSSTEIFLQKGQALIDTLSLEALLVTQGEDGMTLFQQGHESVHIKTKAKEVFDVTGAGDTVIGVLSAAIAAKTPLADAMVLANMAAGIVVGRLGASQVTAECLRKHANQSSELSVAQLCGLISSHREYNEPFEVIDLLTCDLNLAQLESWQQRHNAGEALYGLVRHPSLEQRPLTLQVLNQFTCFSGICMVSDETYLTIEKQLKAMEIIST